MTDPSESDARSDDEQASDQGADDNYASVVQVERHDDVATICGRIDTAPSYAVVLHVRGGNRALTSEIGMRRVIRHAEEYGKIIAIATSNLALSSRARAFNVPTARRPEFVRWDSGGRMVWRLPGYSLAIPAFGRAFQVLVIAAIAVLFIGLLFSVGPSVDVVVYPEAETLEATVSLVASESADAIDFETLTVPAVTVTSSRTITIAIPTTGAALVPTQTATTTMTITNNDGTDVTIPAGTPLVVVVDEQEIGFRIDDEVDVPAGEEVSVGITARPAGEIGNIPAETEVAFVESEFSLLSAVTEEAATGGASEGRQAVDQDDIISLREIAEDLANASAAAETIIEDRPRDAILRDTITVEVQRGDPSDDPGTVAQIVTMDVTASVTALAIPAWVWDELASTILADEDDDPGEYILGSTTAVETGSTAGEDGLTSVEFDVTGEFATDIRSADIADAVKGRSPEDARSTLQAQYGIEEAEIDLTPGWAPRLPRFDFRIDVELRALPNDDLETETESTTRRLDASARRTP